MTATRESLRAVPSRLYRERAVAISRMIGVGLKQVPLARGVVFAVSRRLMQKELRRLHDVLATTSFTGRYWVTGGLLIGWAREGDLLTHDTADVDFNFRADDLGHLRAAVPALRSAGFVLSRALRSNTGELTGMVFERSGIHFDFLKVVQVGDMHRVYAYFLGEQLTFEFPALALSSFDFFGRTWLKAADHDRLLTALYGDWRTPRLDWRSDRDSPAIVAREPHRDLPSAPDDLSDFIAP